MARTEATGTPPPSEIVESASPAIRKRLASFNITEATVRSCAARAQVRYPWRGDNFTLDQVQCLLFVIDELRAELAWEQQGTP